MKTYISS